MKNKSPGNQPGLFAFMHYKMKFSKGDLDDWSGCNKVFSLDKIKNDKDFAVAFRGNTGLQIAK